jgi:trans-aconitate methyltransferase
VRLDARIPEPELMEEPDQARAYAEADFVAPHQAIVDDLVGRHPELVTAEVRAVDLGCGPADVTVRLARRLPAATIVGVDAGPVMLALGRQRVHAEGLADRVTLVEGRLPHVDGLGPFELVVATSVLHHLPDPGWLWQAVRAVGVPGAVVHVADLCRPDDTDTLEAIVAREASGEPAVLVQDFARSLAAAYRPDEVEQQLRAVGLDGALAVHVTSDRHLTVSGRLPA